MLFFALEKPQKCQHVMTSTIDPTQCQMLLNWANSSQTLSSSAQPQISKNMLRKEFERLKPQILIKLEAVHTDFPSDISG